MAHSSQQARITSRALFLLHADSEVEGEGFAEIPAKEGIPEGGGTPEGKSEVTSVAGGQRTPVAGEDTDDVAAASTPGVEVADSQFPSTQDLFGASP